MGSDTLAGQKHPGRQPGAVQLEAHVLALDELGFALGLWEILKQIPLEKSHTREV